MKTSSLFFGMLLAVVVIAILLVVFGVNFSTNRNATYRPDAEVAVTGVVVDTEDFACPVSTGEMGSHLKLKTAQGELVIHLAPARIMRSQTFRFNRGDTLEVRGAPAHLAGQEGLIARQISRGNETFTLRDQQGRLLLVQ